MKKDDIIEAALKEFSHNDFDHASINTIIKESKTSKGTFYYYFESKEDLYLQLVEHIVNDKVEYLQSITKKNINVEKASIFDILRDQIESSMNFIFEYPQYTYFSMQLVKESNSDIKQKVNKRLGVSTKKLFSQLIRNSIDNKQLRSDIPESFITSLLVYLLTHFNELVLDMGVELISSNSEEIKKNLNAYIDFIENGLKYKE